MTRRCSCTSSETGHGMEEVKGLIEDYRGTLTDDRRYMFDRFELLDVARKVVGVGSVGTRCWIALMAGRENPGSDFIVLQAKEAQPVGPGTLRRPVGTRATRQTRGRRTAPRPGGKRRLPGLGRGSSTGHHYYIRQLWDSKGQGNPMDMDVGTLTRYGGLCAWVLARSHARTGDAVMISAYLGKSMKFDRAIAEFARAYAVSNEADHRALVDAKLGDPGLQT